MILKKILTCIFLSIAFTAGIAYSAVNPFLNSNSSSTKQSSAKKPSKTENKDQIQKNSNNKTSSQVNENKNDNPKKLSLFMRKLLHFQRKMRERVASEIENLKTNNNTGTFFWILLLSFFYGVLHAIGPGHGKGVITGWVLSSAQKFKAVTLASSLAALFHALSATVLVSGSYLILKQFVSTKTQNVEASLQIGAGILLLTIGAYTLTRFVIEKIKKKDHHKSEEEMLENMAKKTKTSPWAVALSIGIVPCPVSSVILIFSLTMGLIWQGFIFVIAFALGMALTIFCFAVFMWFLRNKTNRARSKIMHFISGNVFPILGVIFFFISGLFILLPYLV